MVKMFKRYNRHYFDLLGAMTVKEFTVRYKQAIFGFLWVILNPIFQMVIIGVVFSHFVKIPNYFIFLFSGLLPWQLFSLALTRATSCLVNERALLQKSPFPREIIPLSIVMSETINFLLSLGLFVVVILLLGQGKSISPLVLLAGVSWLIFFTMGMSLLTSSLEVRYRDVAFIVQTLVLLWFYATPVVYLLAQFPERWQIILKINPLTGPISLIQAGLLGQNFPPTDLILVNAAISILMVGVGVWVFVKGSPDFTDWL
jgi:lipopolysaccharide transport system permease protein